MTSLTHVFKALLLPCLCLCLPSQLLSNGYSRVANQNTLQPAQVLHTTDPLGVPTAHILVPFIEDSSREGSPNLPKSLVRIPVKSRTNRTPYLDHAAKMSDTEATSEEANGLSAKESLAIFMREHLYGSQSGTMALWQQPMAASLTQQQPMTASLTQQQPITASLGQEQISSMMKKRLSQFVKKLMKAEISEVRVERRERRV